MGWGNWFRSANGSGRDVAHLLGLDVNASRARGAAVRMGRPRPALLDEPREELPLAISLERRSPEVGQAGLSICRSLPHLSVINFLPGVGRPQEWRAGRHRIDAAAALALTFERLRTAIAGYEAIALALPAYLNTSQVARVLGICEQTRLRVRGAACSTLALAAELLEVANAPPPLGDDEEVDLDKTWVESGESLSGIIPMHPRSRQPGPHGPTRQVTGIIVEVDEHALTASLVGFEAEQVRMIATVSPPRLGLKMWKERLLDCLADRCIRLCRRDPRDSAVAEQALYEQLDDALERTRHGQKVNLTVRSAHWFQDLIQQTEDFDGYCAGLARQAAEAVRELSESTNDGPPLAVWVTSAAGRLPGLITAVRSRVSSSTSVNELGVDAVAQATARLAGRWLTGSLPRVYLDTVLPLATRTSHLDEPPRESMLMRGN